MGTRVDKSLLAQMADRLHEVYLGTFSIPSATTGHLIRLHLLASECRRIVEVGVESMITTFAFLSGLTTGGELTCIDVRSPPPDRWKVAQRAAEQIGICVSFLHGSDLEVEVPSCDLLFIDGFHTYQQVITELRVLQGRVHKYIALHDTSPPWGDRNEGYTGDYREYPGANRKKEGVWTAIVDFLVEHPQWKLMERHHHSHGLTILMRVTV